MPLRDPNIYVRVLTSQNLDASLLCYSLSDYILCEDDDEGSTAANSICHVQPDGDWGDVEADSSGLKCLCHYHLEGQVHLYGIRRRVGKEKTRCLPPPPRPPYPSESSSIIVVIIR
ncbi:hypothetical protein Tco_0603865 [Tanacetum coccineum]